ncbi:unnamed protein product, partial [Effrenium voratum]
VCIGADKIYRSSHVGWDVLTSATFLHGFAVVGLNHFCTVFAGQPPGQRSDISVEAFLKPAGPGSRVKLLVSHARGCSGCMERRKTKMRRLEEDDYLPCMDGPADIDDFEDGQSLRYACFGPREEQATLRVLFNEIPHTSNPLVVAGENTRIDVNCVEEERGNPIVFNFNGAAELRRPCTPAAPIMLVLDSTEGLSFVQFLLQVNLGRLQKYTNNFTTFPNLSALLSDAVRARNVLGFTFEHPEDAQVNRAVVKVDGARWGMPDIKGNLPSSVMDLLKEALPRSEFHGFTTHNIQADAWPWEWWVSTPRFWSGFGTRCDRYNTSESPKVICFPTIDPRRVRGNGLFVKRFSCQPLPP